MRTILRTVICTLLVLLLATPYAVADENLFETRILPIAKSTKSSSCTECHFGGVELKNFIGESESETFASLRSQGLIDLKNPRKSKLLTFISRHGSDTNDRLIAVRKKELAAFKAWIDYAVKNPSLLSAKPSKEIGLTLPSKVVQHLRKDRVLESFYENIWVELGRCVNCHSPNRNQAQVKKHGEQMSWIVPGDLSATLKKCVDNQIIDLDAPEESQILTKPNGTEKHGGGPKFAVGSESDKAFRKFLIDYSKTVSAEYKSKSELPIRSTTVRHPTFQFLKITNIPKKYSDKFLQVRLYQAVGDGWSKEPVAIADNPVNGKQSVWMSSLFQFLEKDSTRFRDVKDKEYSRLPQSKFRIEIYVDQNERLKKSPFESLGKKDLIRTIEVDQPWPPGYQKPKTISLAGG